MLYSEDLAEKRNVFNTTLLICSLTFQLFQTDEAFAVNGYNTHTHTHARTHTNTHTHTHTHKYTSTNTSQRESTRINMNQHESDTSQHEPDTSQRESTKSKAGLDYEKEKNLPKRKKRNVTYQWRRRLHLSGIRIFIKIYDQINHQALSFYKGIYLIIL